MVIGWFENEDFLAEVLLQGLNFVAKDQKEVKGLFLYIMDGCYKHDAKIIADLIKSHNRAGRSEEIQDE